MRVNKTKSPSVALGAVAALAAVTLSACADTKPVGTVGYVKGFGGVVAADEPRAVLVARDVLSAGGTAADAAVALYFTMAVTLPSTASLGGGGACVVHDPEKKVTEALDFVSPPSAGEGQVATAVPGNVRGFYALHAKYGSMRWESLLGEAEKLARLGTPVSRAFASDLNRAVPLLSRDPGARKLFFKADGRVLAEGDQYTNLDLAAVIGRLRRAPGEFYAGPQARELAAAAKAAGASLAYEELRDFKPAFRQTLSVKLGDEVAHFPPPPAVAGTVAAQLTALLKDGWAKAEGDERPHLLAEMSARAFAERAKWMQASGWSSEQPDALMAPGRLSALAAGYSPERHEPVAGLATPQDAVPAAGFVVMDQHGGAVACGITTYGMFGVGRVAQGTGIVLAAAPGRNSGPAAVAPAIVVNPNVNELRMALAGSGGVTAPTAVANAILGTMVERRKLAEVLAAPRVHHSGAPDAVFVESGERAANGEPLQKRGHKLAPIAMPSRINALACGSGAPSAANCSIATDPRGFGMGVVVGKD